MKHLMTTITAVFIGALLLAASATVAFAESDILTINGEAKVKVGDTVKFTLYLEDTTEDIIGFELRLFYDTDKLTFDKQSINSEKFDNLFYNPDIEGKIPMNWTDIGNPVSFAKKDAMFTCEFKAAKAGDAEISYFVTELYGDDMTYLKSYKFTYGISVNGKELLSDGVLPISDDQETLNERQGGFINYVDGMGEENSPNQDHEAVKGKEHPTYNVYENQVVEVTRYEDVNGGGKSGFNMNIFLIIGIPVLGAVIVVAVIILMKDKKKGNPASESDNTDKIDKTEE
ncbi:MAG: hypothetical protein IJ598_11450 [Ruminococcus sp.]|nr:hypothetical protein [Lachnospiraceae bacterium]MBR1483562.1 hypothetical protein [Ruminococcus sp.]